MRSRNFVSLNCNQKLGVKRVSQTFRKKENHSRANVHCNGFLLHGASILFFRSNLRGVLFCLLKKYIEIIKIVLLSIFNHEKRQLPYLLN